MKKAFYQTPEWIISAAGLLALGGLYVFWCITERNVAFYGRVSALLCAALFALLCLRFVPGWMDSWRKDTDLPRNTGSEPPYMGLRIFLALLGFELSVILLVYLIRCLAGLGGRFLNDLSFWTCADSIHYLDIAGDGYLSEGSTDRLVQLVFLPGYPMAVRLMNVLVGNVLWSGLLVSALTFSLAGVVIYRMARLDMDHEGALRVLKYLCLMPGSFFFAAPMSESLFLLLSALCVYGVRRDKWLWGCLSGALAAFTRSLGLMLFVPAFFELVSSLVKSGKPKRPAGRFAALFLIPLGYAAYLGINYAVSGDPFKFMTYQSEHWGQRMGFFFNTAAYQLREAVSCAGTDLPMLLGLWLPNLLSIFVSLVIMLLAAKRLRPSYNAWFIAYYVIAVGATWLLSAPRYMTVLLPLPMALSALTEQRRADDILTAIIAVLSLLYLIAFALRWQVW